MSNLNAANADPTATFIHSGTGDGISNDVLSGIGQWNIMRSNSVATVNWMTAAGGIGTYNNLSIFNGTGSYVLAVDNALTPTVGGDVFAFNGVIRTATPTALGIVSGAVFAGSQHGVGHGILINHEGASGRNSEFNVNNPANPDPAIFAVHNGIGNVVVAQNQSNVIPGIMSVGDFAYTGTDVSDHVGVEGFSAPAAGWGIGVRGTGGWFGLFANGNSGATGIKSFMIDHPTEPATKILKHFSIESNEVLNMYRGMIMLDNDGKATVELPSYFQDINIDFSYQLTAIGTPEHPYVFSEIVGNSFEVAGAPNTKVSWTVYADRNDAYLQQNPEQSMDVIVKVGDRAGKYLNPELHGQPEEAGMFYNPNHKGAQGSTMGTSRETLELLKKVEENADAKRDPKK